MKKVLVVVNSTAGAALLTLVFATLTLLYLMFSSDDGDVRRETFFGALMFESRDAADGSTSVTVGVENPVPLVVLFVVLAIMLTVIQLMYRALKQYRQQLLEEQGGS